MNTTLKQSTIPILRIKKGFDLKLAGKPSPDIQTLEKPQRVAIVPEHIPFVKPRLRVQAGTRVNIGSLMFEDKRDSRIKFCSPGGGEITEIKWGPRRIVQEIIITLDPNEFEEEFTAFPKEQIDTVEREVLVQAILDGGLWPFFRQLPYRDIADPDHLPPRIIVGVENAEPFQPDAAVYLNDHLDHFKYGLSVLKRLADNVTVGVSRQNAAVRKMIGDTITLLYSGAHPAENPGVLLYHLKTSPVENSAWYIYGQDLILVAQLLQAGRYPTRRIIAAGSQTTPPGKHFNARWGAPLCSFTPESMDTRTKVRPIVGGVFTGYTADPNTFFGFYETGLTWMDEGRHEEAFGFLRPGLQKISHSRTFLSALNKTELTADCRLNGETRACINCGACAAVCPVDILPQFAFKAIAAAEVEEYIANGLLDCVECGLCTFVCPSKIELSNRLKKAKRDFYLGKV